MCYGELTHCVPCAVVKKQLTHLALEPEAFSALLTQNVCAVGKKQLSYLALEPESSSALSSQACLMLLRLLTVDTTHTHACMSSHSMCVCAVGKKQLAYLALEPEASSAPSALPQAVPIPSSAHLAGGPGGWLTLHCSAQHLWLDL